MTRSEMMRRVRGRDTAPEIKVRKMLWALGARYRLHAKDLPGAPDVVMRKRRLAIFVHGCFWHGHDCARGARTPKANADYWTAKIARNRARDAAAAQALAAQGWRQVVVWECMLRDEPAVRALLSAALSAQASS